MIDRNSFDKLLGNVSEALVDALAAVMKNCLDERTDADRKRKITIVIESMPSGGFLKHVVSYKTDLAPKEIGSSMMPIDYRQVGLDEMDGDESREAI